MNRQQRQDFLIAESTMPPRWWRDLGGTRQDFFDSMQGVTDDVEIACDIITFWGIEGGKYNNATHPVLLMYKYLNRRFGELENAKVSLRDLKQILGDKPTPANIANWVRCNYNA